MPNNKKTAHNIARKIGYRYFDLQDDKEYNLVKDLSGGRRYPRFHLYIKKDSSPTNFGAEEKNKNMFEGGKNTPKLVGDKENDRLIFSLHLDQKFASYEKSGSHKHSGEYDGKVVEKELERIKNILKVPKEGKIYKF